MSGLLWVCAGGAVGSGLRYGTGWLLARWLGTSFPFGTIAVNLIGSFAIGLLAAPASELANGHESLRLLLVTGLLGGFTTYSAYNQECLRMLADGRSAHALSYAAGTLVGCLLIGWAGFALARVVWPRH